MAARRPATRSMTPNMKGPENVALQLRIGFQSLPQEIRDMIWQCVLDIDSADTAQHENNNNNRDMDFFAFGYAKCGTEMYRSNHNNLIVKRTSALGQICSDAREHFFKHCDSQYHRVSAAKFFVHGQVYRPPRLLEFGKRRRSPRAEKPRVDPWPSELFKNQRIIIRHNFFNQGGKQHRTPLKCNHEGEGLRMICPRCDLVESFVMSAHDRQVIVLHPNRLSWTLDRALWDFNGSKYRAAEPEVQRLMRFWLGNVARLRATGARLISFWQSPQSSSFFEIDLDDNTAPLGEWKRIYEAGDPERMPGLLRSLDSQPDLLTRIKEEALAGVRGAWADANAHRERRKLGPLPPLPELKVGVDVMLKSV
ncbi:hypothetical protein B0T14DRAFT_497028 [Immersiella caudata]|uniref:2EXR domain-containing protein n=1 Tax=Immersiella caudata TaxID=314043 RepID=A0AA40C071_9PEZI|nr:hypothetical protein B0T14DRAFT_497028 [Immersiella caudata]